MNWWKPIRLAGFRERLSDRLRSWLLPLAAVYEADLATLVRSWMLRAWFVLTALVALAALLGHAGTAASAPSPAEGVIHAILLPIDNSTGDMHTLVELFKSYVVLWTTFVLLLTGGAISGERPIMADSVLSRGISRWQYFLAKWSARLTGVLGVYLLVMVPTTAVVWLTGSPREAETRPVAQVEPLAFNGEFTGDVIGSTPVGATTALRDHFSIVGLAFGLARVGLMLALVGTCGVALSAVFESTILSIGVAWVSVYGTGLALTLLDIPHVSPGSLFRCLPGVLCGELIATVQCSVLGVFFGATLFVATAAGILFSRRDL